MLGGEGEDLCWSYCDPINWRARALAAEAEVERLTLGLRNVLALTGRLRKRDPVAAGHLRRFCADAGVYPEILRAEREP
jgi:hypothetical protein